MPRSQMYIIVVRRVGTQLVANCAEVALAELFLDCCGHANIVDFIHCLQQMMGIRITILQTQRSAPPMVKRVFPCSVPDIGCSWVARWCTFCHWLRRRNTSWTISASPSPHHSCRLVNVLCCHCQLSITIHCLAFQWWQESESPFPWHWNRLISRSHEFLLAECRVVGVVWRRDGVHAVADRAEVALAELYLDGHLASPVADLIPCWANITTLREILFVGIVI